MSRAAREKLGIGSGMAAYVPLRVPWPGSIIVFSLVVKKTDGDVRLVLRDILRQHDGLQRFFLLVFSGDMALDTATVVVAEEEPDLDSLTGDLVIGWRLAGYLERERGKEYAMPMAPFVGVNHHGQSILLGCGLISNEDTTTFTWLFKSWLTCMSGHAPNAIITDQDQAMKNAIEIVFPDARHRYFLGWDVYYVDKVKSDYFVPSDINHSGYANFPLQYGGFIPSYAMQHPQLQHLAVQMQQSSHLNSLNATFNSQNTTLLHCNFDTCSWLSEKYERKVGLRKIGPLLWLTGFEISPSTFVSASIFSTKYASLRLAKVGKPEVPAEPNCLLHGHDEPAYDVKFYGDGEDFFVVERSLGALSPIPETNAMAVDGGSGFAAAGDSYAYCWDVYRTSLDYDGERVVYGSTVPVLDGEELTMRLLAIYEGAKVYLFKNATSTSVKASLKIGQMAPVQIQPYPS
ncbi:FAR1-related sequence 5-like protein [Tanacetum coccineum]